MSLRKQMFTAFLSLAILPLFIIGIYIFATNLTLAFDLYEKNLKNSTEIQADLIEENVNRLMVRANRLAGSHSVREACISKNLSAEGLSNDILNFTDETLDNVAVFALMDKTGNILYSSGSNSDTEALKPNIPSFAGVTIQTVSEIPFTGQNNSLAIYTPVMQEGQLIGSVLVMGRSDYLLKIISSHRQIDSSNAFIYCRNHHSVIVSKQDMSENLSHFNDKLSESGKGSIIYKMNGTRNLVYYQSLSKIPWVLVSTVPTMQIFSQIWSYGLISIIVLLVVLIIVMMLSRLQSARILKPLDLLLGSVEKFFLEGAAKFPETNIDPKTEIGYLSEKFSNLSEEMTLVQGKIRESNFLYAALLQATYEFRIVLDVYANTMECSSAAITEQINNEPGSTMSEQVSHFLIKDNTEDTSKQLLKEILAGNIKEPEELELHLQGCWYRLILVPILHHSGNVQRIVFHFEDITAKKQEEIRLIQTSQMDPLCSLLNKAAFMETCRLSEDGKTDAMFFIDLDMFKHVNDTLGHSVGDDVLISTAYTIRAQFRDSDICSRFGGDEFVVFAPGINRLAAEQRAKRLTEAISFHLDSYKNSEVYVTASVGICMINSDMTTEQAIEYADQAMYQSKNKGRAQYSFYEGDGENK